MQVPGRVAIEPSEMPKHPRISGPWYRAPALPTVFPTSTKVLCQFARILDEEGFSAVEILARPLELALQVFEEISRCPERKLLRWMIGTITSESKARQAIALAPDGLVSPAFSRKVLRAAREGGIPYCPGVQTFQDAQNVIDAFEEEGLEVEVLKLCPVYGLTPEYVIAMANCYPGIVFCPTGEITLENFSLWRGLSAIGAPMGAELVPRSMLEDRDFDAVRYRLRLLRRLAEDAVRPALPAELEKTLGNGEAKVHRLDHAFPPDIRKPSSRKTSI